MWFLDADVSVWAVACVTAVCVIWGVWFLLWLNHRHPVYRRHPVYPGQDPVTAPTNNRPHPPKTRDTPLSQDTETTEHFKSGRLLLNGEIPVHLDAEGVDKICPGRAGDSHGCKSSPPQADDKTPLPRSSKQDSASKFVQTGVNIQHAVVLKKDSSTQPSIKAGLIKQAAGVSSCSSPMEGLENPVAVAGDKFHALSPDDMITDNVNGAAMGQAQGVPPDSTDKETDQAPSVTHRPPESDSQAASERQLNDKSSASPDEYPETGGKSAGGDDAGLVRRGATSRRQTDKRKGLWYNELDTSVDEAFEEFESLNSQDAAKTLKIPSSADSEGSDMEDSGDEKYVTRASLRLSSSGSSCASSPTAEIRRISLTEESVQTKNPYTELDHNRNDIGQVLQDQLVSDQNHVSDNTVDIVLGKQEGGNEAEEEGEGEEQETIQTHQVVNNMMEDNSSAVSNQAEKFVDTEMHSEVSQNSPADNKDVDEYPVTPTQAPDDSKLEANKAEAEPPLVVHTAEEQEPGSGDTIPPQPAEQQLGVEAQLESTETPVQSESDPDTQSVLDMDPVTEETSRVDIPVDNAEPIVAIITDTDGEHGQPTTVSQGEEVSSSDEDLAPQVAHRDANETVEIYNPVCETISVICEQEVLTSSPGPAATETQDAAIGVSEYDDITVQTDVHNDVDQQDSMKPDESISETLDDLATSMSKDICDSGIRSSISKESLSASPEPVLTPTKDIPQEAEATDDDSGDSTGSSTPSLEDGTPMFTEQVVTLTENQNVEPETVVNAEEMTTSPKETTLIKLEQVAMSAEAEVHDKETTGSDTAVVESLEPPESSAKDPMSQSMEQIVCMTETPVEEAKVTQMVSDVTSTSAPEQSASTSPAQITSETVIQAIAEVKNTKDEVDATTPSPAPAPSELKNTSETQSKTSAKEMDSPNVSELEDKLKKEVKKREETEDWCDLLSVELDAHIKARDEAENRYFKLVKTYHALLKDFKALEDSMKAGEEPKGLKRTIGSKKKVQAQSSLRSSCGSEYYECIEQEELLKEEASRDAEQSFHELKDVRAFWEQQRESGARRTPAKDMVGPDYLEDIVASNSEEYISSASQPVTQSTPRQTVRVKIQKEESPQVSPVLRQKAPDRNTNTSSRNSSASNRSSGTIPLLRASPVNKQRHNVESSSSESEQFFEACEDLDISRKLYDQEGVDCNSEESIRNVKKTKQVWENLMSRSPKASPRTSRRLSTGSERSDSPMENDSGIGGAAAASACIQGTKMLWEDKLTNGNSSLSAPGSEASSMITEDPDVKREYEVSDVSGSDSVLSDSIGNISETKARWEQMLQQDENSQEEEENFTINRHGQGRTSKKFLNLRQQWEKVAEDSNESTA